LAAFLSQSLFLSLLPPYSLFSFFLHSALRELFGRYLDEGSMNLDLSLSMSYAYTNPPTAAPVEAVTPVPTAAPDGQGEAPTFPPTSRPTVVGNVEEEGPTNTNPNANQNGDQAPSSSGPNAGQTALIVVLCVAAVTVGGALIARKIYVSKASSASSISDSSSALEAGGTEGMVNIEL
jgi:hypothetical protein